MRILLTGSSGLIGQAVFAALCERHEVIRLGRRKSADVVMDLSDPSSISDLQLPTADALIHCAGIVDEDFREDPERAFRMALAGADALARRAVAVGVRRLAYISSAHVYGPMIGTLDERSPVNPVSDYAIAHYATEQIFRRLTSVNVAGAAFRPCAVFGELQDIRSFRRWSLIPFAFPMEAMTDRKIVIRSTGQQRRNFVGTLDIAQAVLQWLQRADKPWEVINPVGETSCTVFEFAEMCARISDELLGGNCVVERVLPQGRLAGDDFEYRSVRPSTNTCQSLAAYIRSMSQKILDAKSQ